MISARTSLLLIQPVIRTNCSIPYFCINASLYRRFDGPPHLPVACEYQFKANAFGRQAPGSLIVL